MSSALDPLSKQKSQTLFSKGNEAALSGNYDYAIQMYQDACKIDPGNLVFRQALRGTERRKFGNEPSKVGRLVGAKNQPIRMRARSAKGKGNYTYALEVCEEAFANNPWDVDAATTAAEAAEQLGLKELAQWFLESVHIQANTVNFFKYMAHIHELNASWPKAIAAWERIKKINPNDDEAARQINAISASATIHRSGLGDSLNKHASQDAEPLKAELEVLKQPQLSPEERLQKEIKQNPEMIGPYLQYADHLKLRGQLDDAEKILSRGLKSVPDDPSLKLAHAEVQLSRIQRAIVSWEKKCRERPDDADSKAKLDELRVMLQKYDVDEFRRRIKLHPHDLNLQYELGLRLAKSGQHREAISAFQQARKSQALEVQALHNAGLSFEAEGQLKLAERSFQDALKSADSDDVAVLNALHYRLGRVAEALGNPQAAEEHYNEVAANDYDYLDVAQRLRSLN